MYWFWVLTRQLERFSVDMESHHLFSCVFGFCGGEAMERVYESVSLSFCIHLFPIAEWLHSYFCSCLCFYFVPCICESLYWTVTDTMGLTSSNPPCSS